MIKAEIIADSLNTVTNDRCTTFLLTYPRFIHSEVMTHRMLTKNSSSSRAQPINKIIKDVIKNPALPIRFGIAKKGMQDGGSLSKSASITCQYLWLLSRWPILFTVFLMMKLKLHKQLANRLLEPWAHITVVMTGTDYINFLKLRLHKDAQPEFQELARLMILEMIKSEPDKLKVGEWHIPWGKTFLLPIDEQLVIATSRCARASYNNFSGSNDYASDKRLHDLLISSNHWSPLEHSCQATKDSIYYGNTKGFKSYRKNFLKENFDGSGITLIEIYNNYIESIKQ